MGLAHVRLGGLLEAPEVRHHHLAVARQLIIPSLLSELNCRLTVSMVKPRKSAIAVRLSDNSQETVRLGTANWWAQIIV